MADDDRYQLVTVSGWSIPGGYFGHSYSVIDTERCGEEVFSAYVGSGQHRPGDFKRKRRAKAECARMNAIDVSRRGV